MVGCGSTLARPGLPRNLWGPRVDRLLVEERYETTDDPSPEEGKAYWALQDNLNSDRDPVEYDFVSPFF